MVAQQTPFAVIAAPPLSVISPPPIEDVAAIELIAVVVTVGSDAAEVKLNTVPYAVPAEFVANALK